MGTSHRLDFVMAPLPKAKPGQPGGPLANALFENDLERADAVLRADTEKGLTMPPGFFSLLLYSSVPLLKPAAVDWLLAHGADVRTAERAAKAVLPWLAVRHGNLELVQSMLDHPDIWGRPERWIGLDPEQGEEAEPQDAMTVALRAARLDIVRLLAARVSIDGVGRDGMTFLQRAANDAELAVMAELMSCGADPQAAGAIGRFGRLTPIDLVPDDIGEGWDVGAILRQLESYASDHAARRPVAWQPDFVALVERECRDREVDAGALLVALGARPASTSTSTLRPRGGP